MSLVKTIGELSDYANSVGGLLRLKRREEKWVSIVEWIALNQQVKELTEKLVEALSDADKRIGIHKQEAQKLEVENEMMNRDNIAFEKRNIELEAKFVEANKILDYICTGCAWTERDKITAQCKIKQVREALK
jgi:hypothetical protein